jgi:hypothetical protein
VTQTITDAALKYIGRGLPVLAVWQPDEDGACTCPDGKACDSIGKHPRSDLVPRGVRDATLKAKRVSKWPEDINIGVALGDEAGGVMVIDVDDGEAARRLLDANVGLSDQTGVTVTRRGCHVWFICEGPRASFHVKDKNGKRLGEVRGNGLYVVVAPSKTAGGRRYKWVGRRATDPIPEFHTVPDAGEFVVSLFAEVGMDVEVTEGAGMSDDVPAREVNPANMPDTIRNDRRLFDVRRVLMGKAEPIHAEHIDRSNDLSRRAHSLVDASKSAEYKLTAIELTGVLKKYDLMAYTSPKYADRRSDKEYWRMALKALGGSLELELPEGAQAHVVTDYLWDEDEGIWYWNGGRGSKPICNFQPAIVEEYEIDPGEGADVDDLERKIMKVRFTLKGGRSHDFFLDQDHFGSQNALEKAIESKCPTAYVVEPGMTARLKAGMKTVSRPTRHKGFKSTGWVEHETGWAYLLPAAAGGITADGVDPNIKIDRTLLKDETVADERLKFYGQNVRPPTSKEERASAWAAFMALVELAPPAATIPIVLQILAGPLTTAGAGTSPPVVHVMGMTGTYKSSLCLAALSLFGTFPESEKSPQDFGSTDTALEVMLYTLKDAVLMIDDYKKGTVRMSQARMRQFIQNYANRTARGRAKSTGKALQRAQLPRGLLLTNGEDRWENEGSAEARTIVVHIDEGMIKLADLGAVQKLVTSGKLQLFGGGFLQWLARQHELLAGNEFGAIREQLRDRLIARAVGEKVHTRILSSLATLLTTSTIVGRYIDQNFGKTAGKEFRSLVNEAVKAMQDDVVVRGKEVKESSPFNQFTRMISNMMASGEARLDPRLGLSMEERPRPDKPKARTVGFYWQDGERTLVLLTKDTTFKWYDEQASKRRQEANFTWSALMKEAVDNYGARRDQLWVHGLGRGKEGRSQLSGIVVSLDTIRYHNVSITNGKTTKKRRKKRE